MKNELNNENKIRQELVDEYFDRWSDSKESGDLFVEKYAVDLSSAEKEYLRELISSFELVNDDLKSSLFQKGQEIVENYVLDSYLGQGAFGDVWSATGPGGIVCAVKIMGNMSRADNEKKALLACQNSRHPNILPIYGIWETPRYTAIASSLGDFSLADLSRRNWEKKKEPTSARELLGYFENVAKALDYLNLPNDGRAPIVHGDVKPANIFIVGGGALLGDLGTARFLKENQGRSPLFRTREFAPPEFEMGERSQDSAYSDQYSLAASWYAMRTFEPIYAGTQNAATSEKCEEKKAPKLTLLPPKERAIVLKALSFQPENRYPSSTDFVEALKRRLNEERRNRWLVWILGVLLAFALCWIGARYYVDWQRTREVVSISADCDWNAPTPIPLDAPKPSETAKNERVRFVRQNGELRRVEYVNAEGEKISVQNDAFPVPFACVRFETKNGYLRRMFYDEANRPVVYSRYAGWESKFDEQNRETERYFLNESGERVWSPFENCVGWTQEYDGEKVTRMFRDAEGRVRYNAEGYAGIQTFDDEVTFGRNDTETKYPVKTTIFLDGNGAPTTNVSENVGGRKTRVDDRGRDWVYYIDVDGQSVNCRDGYASRVSYRQKENDGDWVVKEFYELGSKLSVSETMDGLSYAEKSLSFSDTRGQNVDGAFGEKSLLDDFGREKNCVYLDLDGKEYADSSKCSRCAIRYDDVNTERTIEYFGADGQKVQNDECSQKTIAIDENGRTETLYYELTPQNGCSIRKTRYDVLPRELPLEEEFFDAQGKPVDSEKEGFCRIVRQYDPVENYLVSTLTYYCDHSPNGFWTVKRTTYNKNGDEIKIEYFDNEMNQVLDSQHAIGYSQEYGVNSTGEKFTFVTALGSTFKGYQPAMGGFCSWKCVFDAQYREYERTFYDKNRKPCLNGEGVAGWRRKFDEQGREVWRTFLNLDGESAKSTDNYAICVKEYNEQNRLKTIVYGDENSKPVETVWKYAAQTFEYDARGRLNVTRCFDADSHLCLCDDGYAVERVDEFDGGTKRPTRITYLDTDEKPCLRNDGYAVEVLRYENGRLAKKRFFDETGEKPVLYKNLCAGIVYDENGKESTYYDVDGSEFDKSEYHTRMTQSVFGSKEDLTRRR